MDLVIEFLRIVQLETVLHRLLVLHSHKVVIPGALVRNHVESKESVGQKHLHFLVVGGGIALRVRALVLVLAAPLVSSGSELVSRQGARTGGERACDEDAAVHVPGLGGFQDGCVLRDVLGRELGQLVGLRVHPAKGLQVLQILVVWQLVGQGDTLVVAKLRRHHDTSNLLHSWVVYRADTVHVASDLRAKVGNANKLLEHVLGQNIREIALLSVIRSDVDVVGAEVQIGGRDRTHSPVSARAKHLLLVRRGGGDYNLVAMHIRGPGSSGRELTGLLGLSFDLRDLLTLHRRRGNLCPKDDVADFTLRQRSNIHVVLLPIIGQDEVLQSHLNAAPLVIA
mmetsp:Transcript_30628/g.47993  ORF Transcript_30628/g.47993 Transcript_30628/m.47993 type:complete len:339 (-) Transcript_30628:199-1215(-)